MIALLSALGTAGGFFYCLNIMQKIKDFETFAAGYFLGLSIKKPTAEDICRLSVECRAFAAAHVHRPLRAVESAHA